MGRKTVLCAIPEASQRAETVWTFECAGVWSIVDFNGGNDVTADIPKKADVSQGVEEIEMMKTVRVLQVLDYVNYNSGVSAVVMNYYTHMKHDRVQCDFLLFESTGNNLEKDILRCGGKLYTTGKPEAGNILAYQKRIDAFFSQHEGVYDIVHVHIPSAAFAVLRSAKKHGIPVRILHSHNARGADGMLKKIRNYVLNKWGICYANQYYACGEAAARYLYGKKKAEGGQVTIINNAIDPAKYRYSAERREKIREELSVKEELLLGHIGRFVEQKNHRGLLRILAELQKRQVCCKLVMLGDGPLLKEIENEAAEAGLSDKVIFAGVVDNVQDYLSAMDVFLLPSLYEGLPVVCVEAQAAGLACLISANVTREIALTEQVSFVENSDIPEWCDRIEALAGQQTHRDWNLQCDAYDIEKQAEKLEEIYWSYGMRTDSDVHI